VGVQRGRRFVFVLAERFSDIWNSERWRPPPPRPSPLRGERVANARNCGVNFLALFCVRQLKMRRCVRMVLLRAVVLSANDCNLEAVERASPPPPAPPDAIRRVAAAGGFSRGDVFFDNILLFRRREVGHFVYNCFVCPL
jgi:hypothetical protein